MWQPWSRLAAQSPLHGCEIALLLVLVLVLVLLVLLVVVVVPLQARWPLVDHSHLRELQWLELLLL